MEPPQPDPQGAGTVGGKADEGNAPDLTDGGVLADGGDVADAGDLTDAGMPEDVEAPPAEDAAVPAAPVLPPSYGVYVESYVRTRDRETGETSAYTVSVTGLVSVVQEDAALTLTFEPCRAKLPTAGGYQPTVKDSVIRSADPVPIAGTLVPGDPVAFTTDPAALQLGVSLADPLEDPLPTSPNSSLVRDQDGDGRPGITIQIATYNIDVYVGLRVLFSLDGVLGEGDRLEGSAEFDPDYAVYGDNSWFVDVASQVASAEANTQVLSQDNSFVMVPTEGDEGTCAEVLTSGFFD